MIDDTAGPPVPARVPGRFAVALALNGNARVMVATVAEQADEVRERHGLDRPATVLAAEGLVAAVLLSAHIKGEERMTLQVASERPTFAFVADIDAVGVLRARFSPSQGLMPVKTFTGMLSAMKSLGQKELYRGVSPVIDETFEQALHRFLKQSQQTDARVRILCRLDQHAHVRFAAGMLVERLPGISAEAFGEHFDAAMAGSKFEDLMSAFAMGELAGAPVELLGFQDFVFRCSCSRARVASMLRALGREELLAIKEEQGKAEIICHYCNTKQTFDPAALDDLMVGLAPVA